MAATTGKVDYGLLRKYSAQLLCARCLTRGVKTAVAQVISPRHRLQALCPECREEKRRAALA